MAAEADDTLRALRALHAELLMTELYLSPTMHQNLHWQDLKVIFSKIFYGSPAWS